MLPKKLLKTIHQTTREVIQNRQEELKKKVKDTQTQDKFGNKKRSPFLDTLIRGKINGKSLTVE